MIKRFCLFLVCGLTGLTGAAAVHAQSNQCPAWASPEAQIIANTFNSVSSATGAIVGQGPALTTPIAVDVSGVRFEMLLGYRNPWPDTQKTQSLIGAANTPAPATSDGHNVTSKSPAATDPFAFWMPDGRMVERNMGAQSHLRPCEAGRMPPKDEAYVVRFGILWPAGAGVEHDSVTRRFRNASAAMLKNGRLPQQTFKNREHSLSGPITGTQNYSIYHDDGVLAVMLSCFERLGDKQAPNPLCSGHVWDRERQLILAIRFPADKGQRADTPLWRAPVEAALELAVTWRKAPD